MLDRLVTSIKNIIKIEELRNRILFTLGLLAIYRLGGHTPTPGINGEALSQFLREKGGALMGFFDIFSGGALSKLSIFALGIMPYISASIILQLLTVVIPTLAALAKEGESGRRKIIQYTRYGTVLISIIQSFGIAIGLEGMQNGMFVQSSGWRFRVMTALTLTTGTIFIMWLGEQITERGIGNGISVIIFAGIISGIPKAIVNTIRIFNTGQIGPFLLIVVGVMIFLVVAAVVYMESARRKIPVQYAKRVVGRKVYGGQSTHIPLKLNTAGVIPPIFASSLLAFPATIAGFVGQGNPWFQAVAKQLGPGSFPHIFLYGTLIIFFCYFYTAVVLNPVDMADNMKKYGGFIPGVRPGQRTSDYIYKVMSRITFIGAVYLTGSAILPELLISYAHVPFYFGGTSLLIVIVVAMDTSQQIETHMISRHYECFLKKGRMKGTSF
ncbi:MAG: preprotein translocase subunit SecY [Nitrospirae bacterium]|nr:preprotein translocase subunit SecY [Nitrospirota bacterium]